MEGVWETERGAPLLLFAMPDDEQRTQPLRARGARSWRSLILTHELDGEIKGLNEFRDATRRRCRCSSPSASMVGMGVLMLATSWLGGGCTGARAGSRARCRGRCCGCCAGMTFSGWVATVAGWYVTEIGRQPFIVYGLLRTADVGVDGAARR